MKKRHSLAGLAGWLLLSFATALFGAWFPPGSWYAGLRKPPWTPAPFLFGPVWTVLYLLMAVAAWLVWRRDGFRGARSALLLYLVQLALNGAWSWLFFGLHLPGAAAVDAAALWLVLVLTALAFSRHSVPASLLLIPYLLWTGFAVVLNIWIWRFN